MPIELLSCTRQVNNYAFDSVGLNKLLSNCGVFAFIISAMMILLIMFLYPAKPNTSVYVLFKIFVYMYGGTLLLVFLHDGILKEHMRHLEKSTDYDDIVTNLTNKTGGSSLAFSGGGHHQIPLAKSPCQTKTPPKTPPRQTKSPPKSPPDSQIKSRQFNTFTAAKPPVKISNPFEI
jgi:hypothetical protein